MRVGPCNTQTNMQMLTAEWLALMRGDDDDADTVDIKHARKDTSNVSKWYNNEFLLLNAKYNVQYERAK